MKKHKKEEEIKIETQISNQMNCNV